MEIQHAFSGEIFSELVKVSGTRFQALDNKVQTYSVFGKYALLLAGFEAILDDINLLAQAMSVFSGI